MVIGWGACTQCVLHPREEELAIWKGADLAAQSAIGADLAEWDGWKAS